jgi:hypothetical protein
MSGVGYFDVAFHLSQPERVSGEWNLVKTREKSIFGPRQTPKSTEKRAKNTRLLSHPLPQRWCGRINFTTPAVYIDLHKDVRTGGLPAIVYEKITYNRSEVGSLRHFNPHPISQVNHMTHSNQ